MVGNKKEQNLVILAFLLLILAVTSQPALADNALTAHGEILPEPPVAQVVAQFSGSPLSGSAPLTVAFNSGASTGIITGYAWDFNNDGIVDSNLQNPSYKYAAAGTYTVKLTVTGPGGSDDEVKTNYITVRAPPVAAFIGTPTSGNVPLNVMFTDKSTNTPASWKWEYKKGSGTWTQFATVQNPSYKFSVTGSYSIRLTATNAAGSNTATKTNYITVTAPVTRTPTKKVPVMVPVIFAGILLALVSLRIRNKR